MGGYGSGRKPTKGNFCPGCGKYNGNRNEFRPWHTRCAAVQAFTAWELDQSCGQGTFCEFCGSGEHIDGDCLS